MNIAFREFLRRFRLKVPNRSDSPLIYLEFKTDGRNAYQSRIAIFDVSSANTVRYRYVDKPKADMREWHIRDEIYVVDRIVPPASRLPSLKNSIFGGPHEVGLGIIQVSKRHGR